MKAYHANLQDFLRAIPQQFARDRWTETGETFIDVLSPFSSYGAGAENGDYVIVKNHEEEATFKQYKRYDNTKILHPLNSRYNDIILNKDKEYRIVGVVMEKKRYK